MKYDKTLNLIYSNEVIMRDLRALFDEVIDTSLPEVNAQDNEQLGQEYRAHKQAQRMIKDAFEVLSSLNRADSGKGEIKYT